jgi:hypothetical protein
MIKTCLVETPHLCFSLLIHPAILNMLYCYCHPYN